MLPAKIAIITRTKNRPIMLRRAIDSVLSQTFANWHHYIVNDGGQAAVVDEIVREYEARYDGRLRVIHNPTSFTMEAASNTGIIAGNEEYIAIHDDDDSWDTSFLAVTAARLDLLSEDPELGGVATQARVIVEEASGDKIQTLSTHVFSDYAHVSFLDMIGRNQFPPICLLFRRIAMEQVGLFDTSLPVLGDWDFHLRLLRRFRLEVIAEPLANYHHRPAGGEASNSVYKDAASHKRYNADYLDRIIRSELSGGTLSLGELMMHSKTGEQIEHWGHDLRHQLNEMKSEIIAELKSHIDLLFEQTESPSKIKSEK